MSQPIPDTPPPSRAELISEGQRRHVDPWLPAESALVYGSLALGMLLLGILYWLSSTYFPIRSS